MIFVSAKYKSIGEIADGKAQELNEWSKGIKIWRVMMIDEKKFSEMMSLEGKKKDSQAQEKFNQWYNSLNDTEKAEFEKYKKKQVKMGCGIFLAIVLLLVIYAEFFYEPQEPPKPAVTQTQQQGETKVVEPAKQALTGEEADKAEITEIAKKLTTYAEYRDITVTKIVDGDRYNIVLFLNGKDGFTTNLIYDSYKFACSDAFKGLYTSSMGAKINDVKISIYTGMVNSQTGAESEDVIYMLAMTRERANQMNWDNIGAVDIEKAATEKFMHPALKKELQKK